MMSSSIQTKPVDFPDSESTTMGGESRSPTSPIWQAALEKYYGELAKGGIKANTIDKDLWNVKSPDELLAQIETLVPFQATQSSRWSKELSRLQPVVLGLNDLVALTALAVGMNGKVAAVLWGSHQTHCQGVCCHQEETPRPRLRRSHISCRSLPNRSSQM